MKHQRSALALAAILATAALATETNEAIDHPEARKAVQTVIIPRLDRSVPPFSRVRPPQPSARFHKLILAEAEKRLPFEILEPQFSRIQLGTEPAQPKVMVSGYVRLSDKAIFVFDTKTQKHVRSDLDPRFAPQKRNLQPNLPG